MINAGILIGHLFVGLVHQVAYRQALARHFDVLVIIFWQAIIGLSYLSVFQPKSLRITFPLMLRALFAVLGHFFWLNASQTLPLLSLTMIAHAGTLLTGLLSAVIFERQYSYRWQSVVIGFLGIALFYAQNQFFYYGSWIALGQAMLSALLLAISSLIAKDRLNKDQKSHPVNITATLLFGMALISGLLIVFQKPYLLMIPSIETWPLFNILAFSYLAVHFSMMLAYRRLPLSTFALAKSLRIPLYACYDVFIQHHPIGPIQILGCLMMGLALIWNDKKKVALIREQFPIRSALQS